MSKGYNISCLYVKSWQCIFPSDILAMILRFAMITTPVDLLWNQLVAENVTGKVENPIYYCKTFLSYPRKLNRINPGNSQEIMLQKIWDAICYWNAKGNLCFEWTQRFGQTTGLIFAAGIILEHTENLKIIFICSGRRKQLQAKKSFKISFGCQIYKNRINFLTDSEKDMRGVSGDLFLLDDVNLGGDVSKCLLAIWRIAKVKMIYCYNRWHYNILWGPNRPDIKKEYVESIPELPEGMFQEITSFPPFPDDPQESIQKKRRLTSSEVGDILTDNNADALCIPRSEVMNRLIGYENPYK